MCVPVPEARRGCPTFWFPGTGHVYIHMYIFKYNIITYNYTFYLFVFLVQGIDPRTLHMQGIPSSLSYSFETYLFMCVCLHEFMCTMYVQVFLMARWSDLLKLELHLVVSCVMGCWEPKPVLCKSSQCSWLLSTLRALVYCWNRVSLCSQAGLEPVTLWSQSLGRQRNDELLLPNLVQIWFYIVTDTKEENI